MLSAARFLIACFITVIALLQLNAQDLDRTPPDPTRPKNPFSMDLQSLLDMKVTTASKFSEKLSDAPGMMSVITRDDLRRFGGMTLREILERVPGLAGTIASFTDRSIVAVRGDQTKINGGHILFLINGRPTREVLEGGLVGDLLEAFPVGILERIEVIKGPGSVLYGSNAFSGVVNLITQKADHNELQITAQGGGKAAAAPSGRFLLHRGDFSLSGAGQYLQQPDWAASVSTPFFGIQNVTVPNRGKGAYLGANYKGWSFMSAYTEWTTDYTEGGVGLGRWRRGFADAGYNLKPRENWDMSFNLTFTRTTLNAEPNIPFISRNSHEALFEWSNNIGLSARDRLTFGTLYSHSAGIETFFGESLPVVIADGDRSGEAFYAQLEHWLRNNLELIGGFQANKIGALELSGVPRGGLVWNPTRTLGVKLLYSEAFRAPSLNETLLNYSPPPSIGGPGLKGNPDLSPEEVDTVDAGLTFQTSHFQGEAGFFFSRQTGDIVLVDAATAGRYVNLGRIFFHGFEGEGKYYFHKGWFVTGSLLYQTNSDETGNRNITPIANYGAKAGVSYQSARSFTAGLFDVYQGPLHGYSAAANPKPGAYSVLNANVRYDLSKYLRPNSYTGMAFVAHADNLTNHAIWLPDWKDNPGDSTFSDRGRTLYFGLELTLRKE